MSDGPHIYSLGNSTSQPLLAGKERYEVRQHKLIRGVGAATATVAMATLQKYAVVLAIKWLPVFLKSEYEGRS